MGRGESQARKFEQYGYWLPVRRGCGCWRCALTSVQAQLSPVSFTMRALPFSLIAWALVACGPDVLSPNCPEPEPWPDWSCASAKLASVCARREPTPEAVCPEILFHLVSWALNEPRFFFLPEELMAPDFKFVDETTGISTQDQAYERALADSLQCYYRGAEFDFRISSRTQQGACQKACGMVFIRLYHTANVGLLINDQTCMTTCPQAEDGSWRLTEWRILRSVPPAQAEEGFEGATWGEARRRKWEKNYCDPS